MKMKIKSTKRQRFIKLMIVSVSVILSVCIILFLFENNNDDINQGYFKINDVAISNSIDITDLLLEKEVEEDDIKFNLSLNSKIDINIAKLSENVEIIDMYADNFKLDNDNYSYYINEISENLNVYDDTVINLEFEKQNNTYTTNFNLLNLDIKTDLKLKENIEDSNLLNAFDVSIYEYDIYIIKFDLNIVDSKNDVYKAEISFSVNLENAVENGYYVDTLNTGKIYFEKTLDLLEKLI